MKIINYSRPNNISFNGKYAIKLSNEQLQKAKLFEAEYDSLTLKIAKQCGPFRTKFRSLFPGLYTGSQIKGFQLFTTDIPEKSQFHIYKFSQTSPLTMRVYEGKEKEYLFSCIFDKSKQKLQVETTDEYDKKLVKGTFKDKIFEYAKQMATEFEFLLDYSTYFLKIQKYLSPTPTKSEILKLITVAKSKENEVPSDTLKEQSIELPILFKQIKKKLDHKKSAFQIKKAYYNDGQQIEAKGLRFYDQKGESIIYTPLQSADDDRIYRLQRYDKQNNLIKVLIGHQNGTFSALKDPNKPNDIRISNLRKITETEVQELGVNDELVALKNYFEDFSNFIDEFIASHKFAVVKGKYEVKDANEYLKEKELKKATQIKEKQLLKANKIQEKLKIKEEKARIKQEQIIEKKKKALEAIKQKKEERIKKIEPKPSVFTKEILQNTLSEIKNIFAQPIENRASRYSHEKLNDGRIFSGKFFVTMPDNTKISVTRIKSPKYEDLEYFAIKVEKQDSFYIMNMDALNGGIILSTQEGKPILKDENLIYLSMKELANQSPISALMPYYVKELLYGKVKKGSIINSEIKIMKKSSPEEILNAELPPLDNYSP